MLKTISKKTNSSSTKKEKTHKNGNSKPKKKQLPKDSSQFLLPQEKNQNNLNLLGKRFKIDDEMLGFGSFGRTYLGKDIKRQRNVAIKIMIRKKSEDSFYREATVLKSVNYLKHSGFPQMLMSAMNEDICILVEELLGMNLETLRKKYAKLSVAVVCCIGIQLINRLQNLHQCGFIHRDIKPQNILLGGDQLDKSNKIFLIDFGLSISYIDSTTDQHYKENPNHNYSNVVGTALFASINAHMGKDLSRRDDIESLIYTLIYLCTGSLPWKNINIKKKKERHQIIMYMKEEISQNSNFQQNMVNVPQEFFNMLTHSQKLGFDQEPDYKYLKSQMQKILKRSFSIKKMSDIDIFKNNNEDFRTQKLQLSNKSTQDSTMFLNQQSSQMELPQELNKGQKQQSQEQNKDLIDINSIALNFGLAKLGQDQGSDVLNSVQSNEQLAFRSEIDGRSNQEDVNSKLNISMFKQLFASHSMEDISRVGSMNGGIGNALNPNAGRYIDEIPEVEDDDSYGDQDNQNEDDDDDDYEERDEDQSLNDEESKNSSFAHSSSNKSGKRSEKSTFSKQHLSLQNSRKSKQEEEDEDEEEEKRGRVGDEEDGGVQDREDLQDIAEDDGDENYGCEEEIPDDLEVCSQISGYFLNAKDNDLRDIKGGLNSIGTSSFSYKQRSL